MKKKSNILFVCLLFFVVINIKAQSITNAIDDDRQRGYYDRPYKRYEAETGKCITDGNILPASFENINLQSEASNQVATSLTTQNSYIEWTNDEAAEGMVIRFSIPDNATSTIDGTGTLGTLALYVNNVFIQNITLNSFWAWQYFSGSANVAYEKLISNPIYRMRFDETKVKLAAKIPVGASFKLVKTDNNTDPYTIDFVELEPVPNPVDYDTISVDKVQYLGDGSDLQTFIDNNGGKTIYIPEGKYDVNQRIYLNTSNTKLQGAGMWYTQINFTAPLNATDYWKRGLESSANYITVDGLYLSTVNNMRYYLRNDGYQVGKGLNGSFGTGSTVSNVWAEHFECGGWIEQANGLTIQHCRFRNNYADGINLSNGSQNCIVEHCSFRNNGDDDMASWSRVNLCINNTFRYNTSEQNWRAAGIGFFGGKQNKAHHCVVTDPIELGIRLDASFGGAPFSTDGFSEISDISVYKGGTKQNVWRNSYNGSVYITTTSAQYNIPNISFKNIDIINSKQNGISVNNYNNSTRTIGICMENIYINGTNLDNSGQGSGLFINSTIRGKLYYKNITFENIYGNNILNYSNTSVFQFLESTIGEPCNELIGVGIEDVNITKLEVFSDNGILKITGLKTDEIISIYNILGSKIYTKRAANTTEYIESLENGLYTITIDGSTQAAKKALIIKN